MKNGTNPPAQQQEQSKKSKKENWIQKLRNPRTLRLMFQYGPIAYKVGKWLIEFFIAEP